MKIAIIGDMHIGARGSSQVFIEYFLRSFEEFYFDEIKKRKVRVILQLGDLFDVRKNIPTNSLKAFKDRFFNYLEMNNYEFHTLAGNHDIYWRESLEVTSSALVLQEYNNVQVYCYPYQMLLEDDTTIDIIPWICKENEEQIKQFVKNSKSDLCLGHFEFGGFPMYKGHDAKHGIDHSDFARYEKVISGHYHTMSQKDNVLYAGVPYEITWQDHNDQKGIWFFDTETRELEFVKNPISMFYKVDYHGQEFDDFDLMAGKYVRIVVTKKNDQYDAFLKKVYEAGAIDVKIIDLGEDYVETQKTQEIEISDTITVIKKYIDSLGEMEEADKEAMKNYLAGIYTEALNTID